VSSVTVTAPDTTGSDATATDASASGVRHPVNGSCARCSCALSHASAVQDGTWFCCGGCAGSSRCACGCQPDHTRDTNTDRYVPTRRMFGARPPDELRRPADHQSSLRAFPFADRHRGR
jgi:hypothetical protein